MKENVNLSNNGYLCSNCNSYNDILTRYCKSCNSYREDFSLLEEIAAILRRDILVEFDLGGHRMNNEERSNLHAKFFAQGYASACVPDMSITDIIAWEEELETIVIQGKATLHGAGQARREKEGKLSKEDRDKLITRHDLTATEALLAPKTRQDRMSKADKLKKALAGIMSDEDVEATMKQANLQPIVKEAEKKEKSFVFNKSEEVVEKIEEKIVEKEIKLIKLEEKLKVNFNPFAKG